MVLLLQVTRGEDTAVLRIRYSIGDEPLIFGTDDACHVVFPRGNGVEPQHCTLTLTPDGSVRPGADPREASSWTVRPCASHASVKVPALETTEDGGFCEALQAVKAHSAPGLAGIQFVIGGSYTTAHYDCIAEFENDNFALAEAQVNSLGLRVRESGGGKAAAAVAAAAPAPAGEGAAGTPAMGSPDRLPTIRNSAWEEEDQQQ